MVHKYSCYSQAIAVYTESTGCQSVICCFSEIDERASLSSQPDLTR